MNFNHMPKQSLIAYKRYFEMLLKIKENDNLRTFLEQCKKLLK